MADQGQAFPDGDTAHPDAPNAYGPALLQVKSLAMGMVPSSRPDIDARLARVREKLDPLTVLRSDR